MADYPYIVDNVIHPVKDDWAAIVKITEPNTDPAVPRNLTGWVFYLVITKDLSWADDEAYVFKTFTSADPASGEVALRVPAEELLEPGKYYRGIKVKTAAGVRATLISGTFELVAAGPKSF
jgi:hypothetical protein